MPKVSERLLLLQELAALKPPHEVNIDSLNAYMQGREKILLALQTMAEAPNAPELTEEEAALLSQAMRQGEALEAAARTFRDKIQERLTQLQSVRAAADANAQGTGKIVRTVV